MVWFARFGTHNGNRWRYDTRLYLNGVPDREPQPNDSCRAIVYLKNPGGSTQPKNPSHRGTLSGNFVEVVTGRMLTNLGPIFSRNAQKAQKPFRENEYVLAANLVTVIAKQVNNAVRIYNTSGSISEAQPSEFDGIWFAWGAEPGLDPFRKNTLAWYHGLKSQPPPACFVRWQGATQTGVLGAPKLGDNVKHPTLMQHAAIDAVLWRIL